MDNQEFQSKVKVLIASLEKHCPSVDTACFIDELEYIVDHSPYEQIGFIRAMKLAYSEQRKLYESLDQAFWDIV